ncbi:MAG: carboxypeptidase regulatory-like domain-containing protein [Planctomycetes bacterium]|nr:carboxypeptidase regulatory-like domain-containing protein [Planctomycetota bacterium]
MSESPVRVRVAADVPAPVVELRLVAAAAARVRVLAPDGTPIAARVDALHPEDGRLLGTGWSFGDRAGIHVVEGIPPGPVQFRAKHDDWYDVTTTVCAESGRTIELDLQLGEEGAVLRVAVRDVADRAVAGARVRLFTPKGDEVYWDLDKYTKLYAARFFAAGRTSFSDQDYRHEIEQTSPEGRLERRFLPPGEYAVVVSAEGYRTERRSVSVRLETENTVEIVLLRAP